MRKRLGEILVAEGRVAPAALNEALALQARDGNKLLGAILVDMGAVTDEQVARGIATQHGLPYVDPTRATVDPALVWKVPRELAERHCLVPLDRREDGKVGVAMADPGDPDARRDAEVLLRATIAPHAASATAIRQAIHRHYGLGADAQRLLAKADTSVKGVARGAHVTLELDADLINSQLRSGGQQPYIDLLNFLLLNAIERRASDIHLEPDSEGVRVRFRIDGLLRETLRLPRWAEGPLVSRIKVVGELDVASHRRAQDGKVTATLAGRRIDLRVAVLPTQFGEKVVIRLLDPAMLDTDLGTMGWQPRQLSTFYRMVSQPQGLVVVVGPTGSGKSTTLYGALNRLRAEHTSIVSVEDPIEYTIDGVSQVQVDEKGGMTFANAVRSILRQDPNVIVIGEIRDGATAAAAVEAATTGHLVLSTLHTTNAIGSITRLLDLGVPPYLLGSALLGAVAQRLVRRVCAECSHPADAQDEDWDRLGVAPHALGTRVRRAGPGCPKCQYTGYSGRIGVFEVLHATDPIRGLVFDRGTEQAFWTVAREEGLTTLLDDALYKVRQGTTTMEEVGRVVPVDPWRVEVRANAASLPGWAVQTGAVLRASSRPPSAAIAPTAQPGPLVRRAADGGAPDHDWERHSAEFFLAAEPAPLVPAEGDRAPASAPAEAAPASAAPAAEVAQPTAPSTGATDHAEAADAGEPATVVPPAPVEAAPQPQPLAATPAPPTVAAAITAEPSRPATVLVVDDAEEIRQLVGITLEDSYTVRFARDGVEALEAVEESPPDLIVLDVMMPRLSGYDVCIKLKERKETERIPVLMLSARGERSHITKGFYAGADDYLPKPFDPEELELRIRALLRRAGRAQRGA
jgi:type IV pilus assembly protein PilB